VDCGVVGLDRRTRCMPVAHRWLNRLWAIQRMKLWRDLTLNLVSERMATFGLVFYSYRLQTIEVFIKSHVQTLIRYIDIVSLSVQNAERKVLSKL